MLASGRPRPGGYTHRPYRLNIDSRPGRQTDHRCAGVRCFVRSRCGDRDPLVRLGLVFREQNPDLAKRYFREAPGTRRTHIHVRCAGSSSEQFALLFRDYLREHEADAQAYAALKYRLAEEYADDREGYTEVKGLIFLGNDGEGRSMGAADRVGSGNIGCITSIQMSISTVARVPLWRAWWKFPTRVQIMRIRLRYTTILVPGSSCQTGQKFPPGAPRRDARYGR